MVHLGDEAQLEAHFGPFRDTAYLDTIAFNQHMLVIKVQGSNMC
jgi:hypothetical protein